VVTFIPNDLPSFVDDGEGYKLIQGEHRTW
jgi:hypothetical protein